MDSSDRARELIAHATDIYHQATANMQTELETRGFFDLLDQIAIEHGDDLIIEAECQALTGQITPDELNDVRRAVTSLRQSLEPAGLSTDQVEQFQAMMDNALKQMRDDPPEWTP